MGTVPNNGPYETERDVYEATNDAYGHPHAPGHMRAWNRARLTDACETAGVELGGYDRQVVEWLTRWEPEVIASIAGLIARAGGAR